MNYLDASIRGIKLQKKQIPNSKKIKYDASIGELNPKRLKKSFGRKLKFYPKKKLMDGPTRP
jgi:hypothetical protein